MRPATVTVWPVRGFRRVRGFLRATENVPNPTSVTASPRFSEALIPPSAARSARSVPALGQPDAAAIRATISAFVISAHTCRAHLHPERAPRLVHHGLVDGRVAVLGGESLDRASRHRTDERRNPLHARLRLGRPPHGRRLDGGAFIHHGGEWTAAGLLARIGLHLAELGHLAL